MENQDRRYWIDLFTGKTWEEFLKNGGKVTGFRTSLKKTLGKINIGDYLICYITGVKLFVGILEVTSDYFEDQTQIWEDDIFPCRLKVKLLHNLSPENGITLEELKDKLSIFKARKKTKRPWVGFFRRSLTEFKKGDEEIIINEIKQAEKSPVEKGFDKKLYWKAPRTFESNVGDVTIPDSQDEEISKDTSNEKKTIETNTHTEIQWILLKLGADMGLDVWVAKNDINRSYKNNRFKGIERLRDQLPRQFDEATNRTIELIDVLWLERDAIKAAFEIEHTTSIYSGLLRMSDLVSMQPNINIKLYLVAPDERSGKCQYFETVLFDNLV